jgi:hypothetical protein
MYNDDEDDDTTTSDDSDGSDDSGSNDDSSDDSQPAAKDVEASRGALGAVLSQLQDNGIDINALAAKAGIDTTDIDQMEHGDLIALAQHVATTHPEVAQSVLGDFPAAQGLLGRFL